MTTDWISIFCKGAGKRFDETACEFYIRFNNECELLREYELQEVFECGRCDPTEMLKKAVEINLYEYRDLVQPDEYVDSITFEASERLKQGRLRNGFTLYVLKGYINITAYRRVRETLEKEGLLLKRQCGYCLHLSSVKPHSCQRERILTHEGELDNPLYETPRRPSDRSCKQGFEPLIFEPPERYESSYGVDTENRLIVIAKLLHERIEQATGDMEKRYGRQYIVFCKLIQLLEEEDIPWQTGMKRVAETLGVSQKTIARDINEILHFLDQEDVLG